MEAILLHRPIWQIEVVAVQATVVVAPVAIREAMVAAMATAPQATTMAPPTTRNKGTPVAATIEATTAVVHPCVWCVRLKRTWHHLCHFE